MLTFWASVKPERLGDAPPMDDDVVSLSREKRQKTWSLVNAENYLG